MLHGKTVLTGGNLRFHFSPNVIHKCTENNIAFVCLVPDSTHLTQPLDVGFFCPFKEAWRNILHNVKKVNPSLIRYLTDTFRRMDTVVINKKTTPERVSHDLKSCFHTCSIVPFDQNAVLKKDSLP